MALTQSLRQLLVRLALVALAAGGAVGGAVVLYAVPPTPDSYYPGCHFHRLTGLHCPGCGTTRGLSALLHGRLAQAVAYNPLMFLFLPAVGLSVARSLWAWAWGREIGRRPPGRLTSRVTWALGVVLVVFWVVRNIPGYPFTLLAPHDLSP